MVQIYKKGQGKYTRLVTFASAAIIVVIVSVALSEFLTERKEGIESGAYEIEIANVDDGDILELSSFGISVSGHGRFKINIDLTYRKSGA